MGKEKGSEADIRNLEAWRRLSRVMSAFMGRVGTDGFPADVAAERLQAAMEGNLVVASPPSPTLETPTRAKRVRDNRSRTEIINRAARFVVAGLFDKAITEYLKIVNEDPQDVRTWLKIGDLYIKGDSRDKALETYQKVAEIYAAQGYYLKAVAVYKQILKLDSTLVAINLKLAELYRMLGLLTDALGQLEIVAAAYATQGKNREMIEVLEQMVTLDTASVTSWIKLAEAYSNAGRTEEAATHFAAVCGILRETQRTDDFIKVAERLLFHKPDDVVVGKELALLYLARKDGKRALVKLQQCYRYEQKDAQILEMLIDAFDMLGQHGKVRQIREELLKLYEAEGRGAEAIHLRVLMEELPGTLDNMLAEVAVLEKHDCIEKAVHILRRFTEYLRRNNQFDDYLIATERLFGLTHESALGVELIELRLRRSFDDSGNSNPGSDAA